MQKGSAVRPATIAPAMDITKVTSESSPMTLEQYQVIAQAPNPAFAQNPTNWKTHVAPFRMRIVSTSLHKMIWAAVAAVRKGLAFIATSMKAFLDRGCKAMYRGSKQNMHDTILPMAFLRLSSLDITPRGNLRRRVMDTTAPPYTMVPKWYLCTSQIAPNIAKRGSFRFSSSVPPLKYHRTVQYAVVNSAMAKITVLIHHHMKTRPQKCADLRGPKSNPMRVPWSFSCPQDNSIRMAHQATRPLRMWNATTSRGSRTNIGVRITQEHATSMQSVAASTESRMRNKTHAKEKPRIVSPTAAGML
mmetsp:Transcript_83205/g.254381  ORF Transcript_83205/g.254381 Transcript_83205/m.254381 type:complete len:303 (-) Transcript_83205:772-1680(-)